AKDRRPASNACLGPRKKRRSSTSYLGGATRSAAPPLHRRSVWRVLPLKIRATPHWLEHHEGQGATDQRAAHRSQTERCPSVADVEKKPSTCPPLVMVAALVLPPKPQKPRE